MADLGKLAADEVDILAVGSLMVEAVVEGIGHFGEGNQAVVEGSLEVAEVRKVAVVGDIDLEEVADMVVDLVGVAGRFMDIVEAKMGERGILEVHLM